MPLYRRLLFFLLIMPALGQCTRDPGFKNTGRTEEMPGADLVIINFEVSNYRHNRLIWHLKSNEAYIYETNKQMYFDGVDLVQYEGPRKSYVKAGKGVFDEESRIMTIEENVEVTSPNGRRLYSEYLKWDENNGKIITDRPVKIIFPEGDVIHGKHGMITDQRLERIELLDAEGVHLTGDK